MKILLIGNTVSNKRKPGIHECCMATAEMLQIKLDSDLAQTFEPSIFFLCSYENSNHNFT